MRKREERERMARESRRKAWLKRQADFGTRAFAVASKAADLAFPFVKVNEF